MLGAQYAHLRQLRSAGDESVKAEILTAERLDTPAYATSCFVLSSLRKKRRLLEQRVKWANRDNRERCAKPRVTALRGVYS